MDDFSLRGMNARCVLGEGEDGGGGGSGSGAEGEGERLEWGRVEPGRRRLGWAPEPEAHGVQSILCWRVGDSGP